MTDDGGGGLAKQACLNGLTETGNAVAVTP